MSIEELVGETLIFVKRTKTDGVVRDELIFQSEKDTWRMYHEQDCCEYVTIDDINGDLNDLVGTPVIKAYESTSYEDIKDMGDVEWGHDSHTWTFYHISTTKGSVVIRWYGSSNGYYSESASFVKDRK